MIKTAKHKNKKNEFVNSLLARSKNWVRTNSYDQKHGKGLIKLITGIFNVKASSIAPYLDQRVNKQKGD